MKQHQRAFVPARRELEPRQEIERFSFGALERAQVAEDRSPRRSGHLKIDRPTGEKSSAAAPMTLSGRPGLSNRIR